MKLSRRITNVVGSTTLAITARAKELKAQGFDVVNFAGGEPDFDTPDFIKDAAVKALEKGFTKYTPSTGTPELKEAISQKFKKDNNLDYTPAQIVVSCGAKHCLYNLVEALVEEGDEVVIPAPFWVSYPEMVKLAGGIPKIVATSAKNNFKLTADLLLKNISAKTRVLVLNSPSNPTGVLYTRQELSALAEICVARNIFVISDEIYEKLVYDNAEFVAIASLGKEIYNLTATVNGVSKTYSMTGWRIGYFGAPKELAEAVKNFQDHTTSNPCSISQVAAMAAIKASEESVTKMRDEFRVRRDLMMSYLDKIPQVSYIKPQGAFYVFTNISQLKMGSNVLAKRVLDEINVALIPGEGFGADDYVRLSFSTSQDRIHEGMKRLTDWIKKI